MTIYVNGRKTERGDLHPQENDTVMVFGSMAERGEGIQALGLSHNSVERCESYDAMRYDYARDFDYMQLDVLDLDNILKDACKVQLMITPTRLAVFHDGLPFIADVEEDIDEEQNPRPSAVLFQLFSHLTWDDAEKLEDMEERITDLDDAMAEDPHDCLGEISVMRRKILRLKRYYEALLDVLEDAQENRNGLYDADQLKSAKMMHNRVNRLFSMVMSLRDYVTQARESYQSQMDIKLNEIVKLLTIVTTVGVPLQLLVGWYGMNLMMPEYESRYGYPIIIAVSLAITVACVVYFKKKKWF